MPRKKNAKNANKKSNSVTTILKFIQETEKSLCEIPSKLANELNKEISTLSNKAKKLQVTISKLNAKVNAKSKSNSKAAKKMVAKCLKEEAKLSKQLEDMSSCIDALKSKQSKLIALNKHLRQFERDWSKQEKAKKTPAKTSKETTRAAKKSSRTSTESQSNITMFETSMDDHQQEQDLENTGT